jgi:hypothetical protein
LIEALTGHFDDHHAAGRCDAAPAGHVPAALLELDATIAAAVTPWANDLELLIWFWPCPECGGIIAAWEPRWAGERSLRRP